MTLVLHVGVERARELVLLINDPQAAERAVREARKISPNLHKVVRSRYMAETGSLLKAGASVVIPAELEASAAVVNYILDRHCVGVERKNEQLDRFKLRRTEYKETLNNTSST